MSVRRVISNLGKRQHMTLDAAHRMSYDRGVPNLGTQILKT